MLRDPAAHRPKIGIPASLSTFAETGYVYQRAGAPYVQALVMAGAIPMIVPVVSDSEMVDEVLALVDGVVLQGGADICPHLYGQEKHPSVQLDNDITDNFEIALCRRCVDRRKPLLAICRGMQILNVALGGTLIQDIPSCVNTSTLHRQSAPREAPTHAIRVNPVSRIGRILGSQKLTVNSFHHQAIDRLGEGLRATARSEDGIIEGLETENEGFVIGVQFHPEETMHSVPLTAQLFKALVDAARSQIRAA